MIVVKIELWPRGDKYRAKEIGRMYIANVGGTAERGDYLAAVNRRGDPSVSIARNAGETYLCRKVTRSGAVKDYPRQSYSVWRLIVRALKACFPEEAA